jgi:hypothetical protein
MSDEVPPNEEVLQGRIHSDGPSDMRKRPDLWSRSKSIALRPSVIEPIVAAIGSSYRRNKVINAELDVLLDVEEENEMLRDLEDLLAQESDRFAEDLAKACQAKIRWAERGLDSSSALIDAVERAFSLSRDVERTRRIELLLKATRRYSVQRARQLRRPHID